MNVADAILLLTPDTSAAAQLDSARPVGPYPKSTPNSVQSSTPDNLQSDKMRTIRQRELRTVFEQGKSPLMKVIARISVLYEDLRLETRYLATQSQKLAADRTEIDPFAVFYYIRRSLISLQEFRSAFETVQRSSEFKEHLPFFSKMTNKSLQKAKAYFVARGKEINDLRNEIGGHYKPGIAEYAVDHLPAGVVGTVEWNSDDDPFALSLHLAADLLAAGLGKNFQQQADTLAELQRIIGIIGEGYVACQEATYALFVEFAWSKLTEQEGLSK